MGLLNTVSKAFSAIGDIGVTAHIRPEEAKHIRYFNIGCSLFIIINLGWFLQSLGDEQASSLVQITQISSSVLMLLVYFFHNRGQYNAARVFGFSLFYAASLVTQTLSGKEIADHYFILAAIGYAFLVFPRKERRLMTIMILLGFLSYLTILVLYEHVESAVQADPSTMNLMNQITLYTVFAVFIIFLISGRNFTDKMEASLMKEREKLAEMSAVLKRMFGRYLSTEVMNSLIENPSALELGGHRRRVTIMMTDLRGFTALAERLEPEQVVQMLNVYFEIMVEIVLKYNGTINEIIGDALLIVFGAPQEMADRAQRAIACAIEMQNAMGRVNEENRSRDLPELEMGIGLNETEAIVGNIGSTRRSKYAVVGSGVNMTSRIESYTVGGQILISESVRQEAGEVLRIDAQRDVIPKGADMPLRIYEVGGISGRFNIALEKEAPALVTLARQIPLRYKVLEGKDVGEKGLEGFILRLSASRAEIKLSAQVGVLTNLKMNLADVDVKLSAKDFYGKVTEHFGGERPTQLVRFTSIPPEIDAYFQAHLQLALS